MTTENNNFQINYFNPAHLESVQRISNIFINSELVPKIYQLKEVGKEKAIANTIIALDMASRLNANPLMIMQNLNIIQGRPSWSSKFLISTINTCGKYESIKFKFEEKENLKGTKYITYKWDNIQRKNMPVSCVFDEDLINIECIAYTKEKGSNDVLESAPISLKMAIDEGWYFKTGSKWQTMSKQMLMYRSASFWCNIYAPELSMGIKTDEENNDLIDITEMQNKPQTEPKKHKSLESLSFDKNEPKIEPNKPQNEPNKPKTLEQTIF